MKDFKTNSNPGHVEKLHKKKALFMPNPFDKTSPIRREDKQY